MAPKTSATTLIERKRTASANFHRAKPIEIHRSRTKVVTLVPAAVRHDTTGWNMTATLTEYNPKRPEAGKVIRLDEHDVEVLAHVLNSARAAMQRDREGRYVVVELQEDATNLAESVSSIITAITARPETIEQLAKGQQLGDLHDIILHAGRMATLKNAVAELETAVHSGEGRESFYQAWCKRNSWAFGFNYLAADDVRTISREDQIDLLLPRLFGGYRDLVELKTPTAKVLEKLRDFYCLAKPSAEALAQALHYLEVLQRHAQPYVGLYGARHIHAYRPQAIVVIGSSAEWTDEMKQAWHAHNSALTDVQLWTFEELIERGRRAISVLSR